MKWTSISLALLLSASIAQAAPPPRKANAQQLLALAETGLSETVRAAHASERLDPARSEQRPFWSALDKMSAGLQRVRAGLVSRDGSFFHALEEGSANLGELRVVWARTGVADPGVSQGLRILSSSYELLRSGYGREAVRHRQGGGLTQEERQRFLRIQRMEERFAESLRVLEERARQRADQAMLAELRRMAEEANRIAAARVTLEAYLNALMIGDAQRGEWTGNSHFASTEDRTAWLEAGAVVEELYVEEDVGHVVTVSLGNLDEPTELPEELAEAVEVYEPSSIVEDDVDPLEEEEALAEEEMGEETEAEGSDLEAYEDVEDPEAAEEVDPDAPIEVEELPVEKPTAVAPIAPPVVTPPAPAPEAAPPKAAAPAPAKQAPKQKAAKKKAHPPGMS